MSEHGTIAGARHHHYHAEKLCARCAKALRLYQATAQRKTYWKKKNA